LRISAPAVVAKGLSFGRGAASITVRSGKLIANIAELELQTGTASAQVTIDANELIPHYTLRGKIENLDTAAAAAALLGTSVLAGRSILSAELAASGQTPAEVSRTMSGKASLSMPDGGKLALDVRSLRAMAKTGDASGWGTLAKGQTSLENVEARAYVMDGILISELVQARFGPGLLVATGNVDLVDRTLDLRLAVKAEPPVDRQSKSADVVAEDAVNIRGPWREPAIRGDTNTSEAQK
jgi:uncharacterized protein involved in outer membrane biogenesis